jgi:chromosome segregation protein
MQLSLLSRFASGATLARSEPPSTVPGAWRDSAILQLDALAAANDTMAASARRRKIAWAVVLGGAALWLLSASLSTSVRDDAPRRPPSVAPSALAPVTVPTATPSVTRAPADPPAAQADALPVAVAPIDDAARKPVVAVPADARRKAAALAQERARLDEQALRRQRELEQTQAERASEQQQADAIRERAAAAEQARRQSMMLAQNSHDTRRDVREVCASSGGFIAQQFCQARECRKADLQDDAVCQRLREIEVARLLHGSDH